VAGVHPRHVGHGVIALGGGRTALGDAVDHRVGFVITAKPGDRVEAGEPLATIHARDAEGLALGAATLDEAIAIAAAPVPARALVSHRVTRAGIEPLAR
jgi:thymidine phosphorylase